jgi:hypothetical protein
MVMADLKNRVLFMDMIPRVPMDIWSITHELMMLNIVILQKVGLKNIQYSIVHLGTLKNVDNMTNHVKAHFTVTLHAEQYLQPRLCI